MCLEHEYQTNKHGGIHQSLCFSLQSKVQVMVCKVAQPRSTVSTCRVPRDQGRPLEFLRGGCASALVQAVKSGRRCGKSYSSAIVLLQLLTSLQWYSNGENRIGCLYSVSKCIFMRTDFRYTKAQASHHDLSSPHLRFPSVPWKPFQ